MSTNETILIVDDEAQLSRSLAMILQRAGYMVSTAASGDQALQLMQAGAYDLAFFDIKMPDQSGIELLGKVRSLYPDMPVLMLTAHASLDSAIEAVRAGARDYLLKPIDPDAILASVRKVLEDQKLPKRQRAITSQIQSLLSELNAGDGKETSPYGIAASAPMADPARYLKRGQLALDLHTRHVILDGRIVSLPPSTFDFLATLVRHSPQPVSYDTLVLESQGYQGMSRIEAKEISRWQVHEIRKALEEDIRHPHLIITVRDVGYRLVV